jgi:thiosulfate/3-mercaptopyruvate sulfurtransferase
LIYVEAFMHTRNRSTLSLIVVAALALAVSCRSAGPRPIAGTVPPMDTLVTTAWLSQHLGDPDLVVLDCTVGIQPTKDHGYAAVSGRADYERGHIPGAGFADLKGDLVAHDTPLSFALPSPQSFAAAMAALGVGDGSRVVLYSANNPAWAARVWWMLRWIGFDRAAVLDGGLKAWTADGQPLSTAPADRLAQKLSVSLRPRLIADRTEVRAAVGDRAVTIIDALSEASFHGNVNMYARPGHIPGALNVPATGLTDQSGHYLPQEKLLAMFPADHAGRVITYCGGGIAASSDAFVMSRLGFSDVAVYTASLQEWAADPANPMEADAKP